MTEMHIGAGVSPQTVAAVHRGRWYPEMPPALPGETDDQYTNRLTGADKTGRRPYDHPRNRQCSLGYHEECSDPAGERCKCPCHQEAKLMWDPARSAEPHVGDQMDVVVPVRIDSISDSGVAWSILPDRMVYYRELDERDRLVSSYDSRPDTLFHSLRVGELVGQVVSALVQRMTQHDLSKTQSPEVEVFDRVTPRLRVLEYGSDEYKASLKSMGSALDHHYANNRHHPEHDPVHGVEGMTLVDLVEMLCDWKAATERHQTGDLATSLDIQRDRFGLDEVALTNILENTAREFGWLS